MYNCAIEFLDKHDVYTLCALTNVLVQIRTVCWAFCYKSAISDTKYLLYSDFSFCLIENLISTPSFNIFAHLMSFHNAKTDSVQDKRIIWMNFKLNAKRKPCEEPRDLLRNASEQNSVILCWIQNQMPNICDNHAKYRYVFRLPTKYHKQHNKIMIEKELMLSVSILTRLFTSIEQCQTHSQ